MQQPANADEAVTGASVQGRPVLRFAPSPNGYLHAGHAYSALVNARLARRLGGRLLLRFEDIDLTRCRPEFEAAALEDLEWLGLRFDGPPRRQSEHFDAYAAHIGRLTAMGLTYPCFCSRRQIAAAAGPDGPRDPDGAPLYPGLCRHIPAGEARRRIAAGEPHALRLDMAAALRRALPPGGLAMRRLTPALVTEPVPVDPAAWGDVVLARKETPTSYHVSVVVDDALQGVTHVVRGQDLEAATAVHRLLQQLWGLPEPVYFHHRLVRDETGGKLAKSLGSKPLRQLRAEGVAAAELRASLGFAEP
ncbi:tRNA glutamyl-Q(34) synthetase GluQRS [Camelimonas abortus]|uniref:tRNA glutamyl-Q(34) synthetase GluQRS n=1 Tax=Camelimonas abortus TaxID=1017184 RepID=A0ABV7LEE5_9HYPH